MKKKTMILTASALIVLISALVLTSCSNMKSEPYDSITKSASLE